MYSVPLCTAYLQYIATVRPDTTKQEKVKYIRSQTHLGYLSSFGCSVGVTQIFCSADDMAVIRAVKSEIKSRKMMTDDSVLKAWLSKLPCDLRRLSEARWQVNGSLICHRR
jgi:hypothetical protein